MGRSHASAVALPDRSVSQRHAILEVRGGTVMVRDLASKNGTFVNDAPASAIEAKAGDQIRFGRFSFGLEVLDPEDAWMAVTGPGASMSPAITGSSHSTAVTHTQTSEIEVHRVRAFVQKLTEAAARGERNLALDTLRRELSATSALLLRISRSEPPQVVATAGPLVLDPTELNENIDRLQFVAETSGYRVSQYSSNTLGIASRRDGERILVLVVPGDWPVGSAGAWLITTTLSVLSLGIEAEAFTPQRDKRSTGLVFPEAHLRCPSERMSQLYTDLGEAVDSQLPVLVQGETGVGKESIAAILHRSSKRASGPLVAINCAAVPADLLEAELFGVAQGAATGVAPRVGKLESANGGMVLLDEIGEMRPDLQAKLLRVLEQGTVEPIGGSSRQLDIRLVASTNRDLHEDISTGRFRADLFYRISGFIFEVPPLRHRAGDIPALVEHFFLAACKETDKPVQGITYAALKNLSEHDWPGNVRELRHSVYRAVHATPSGEAIDSLRIRKIELLPPSAATEERTSATKSPGIKLQDLERAAIREALDQFAGNQAAAARALGISRGALRRRIGKFDLKLDR